MERTQHRADVSSCQYSLSPNLWSCLLGCTEFFEFFRRRQAQACCLRSHGLSDCSRADVACSWLNFILWSSGHTPHCLPGLGGSLGSLWYLPTFVPPPVGPTEAESWPPSRDEMFRWRKWKPGPKMAPCFPSGIKPAGKGGLGVQSDRVTRWGWTLQSGSV